MDKKDDQSSRGTRAKVPKWSKAEMHLDGAAEMMGYCRTVDGDFYWLMQGFKHNDEYKNFQQKHGDTTPATLLQ